MDENEHCEKCGTSIGWREGVHLGEGDGGESSLLGARCANLALAEAVGVDFDHPNFAPMTLQDAEGVPHSFKFLTHIVPTGISIAAVAESTESGYEFQVIGELGDDTIDKSRFLVRRN